MADKDDIKEFPDVTHKLAAPKKLSAFEKERLAAEEKRKRAEAENAAALRAFEDSFADEDDDPLRDAVRGRGPPTGPRGGGMGYGGRGGQYGGPPSGPRSGLGSLGPGPGLAPPSLKRKRALEEMREAQEARREQVYEDPRNDRRYSPRRAAVEEDHEDTAPKPTVQLSSLPPNMTSWEVEALLRDHLKVYSVHFQPPAGPGTVGKRSLSAIATLEADTATAQIDAAVSALKDRYLGCGFYLSISRHLSSVALHPSMAATITTATSSEPFGAEKPREQQPRHSMRSAPPPAEHRGFAPPGSFDSPVRGGYRMPAPPEALVEVHAPLDIATIRAIHVLVERLTTESDPKRAMKTEALLIAMPEVQRDERFAFLYDSRSPAGVYYRYLLWGPDDTAEQNRRAKCLERIHDDKVFEWAPPHGEVPFLDLTSLADVVTDMDYVSSDEESDDEGADRRFNDPEVAALESKERKHLSPVKRARLVHVLSRLPTTNARLRKGDVARITNFAITHAGQGAEEIVDLLLLNIEKPFAYSLAAKYEDLDDQDSEDEYSPDEALPSFNTTTDSPPKDNSKRENQDTDPSNAKLIALYLISDILSASSTAGARNAWKYRQLFEVGFKAQRTFERLGRLEKELGWGRLKAEQWKRKVGVVFGIWEGWSVFSSEVQEELRRGFFEPPLSEEEARVEQEAKDREEEKRVEGKMAAKFKKVWQGASASASPAPADKGVDDDVDGQPMNEDVDGLPLVSEDVAGLPMAEEDIDGAPMEEDVDGLPMSLDGAADEKEPVPQATQAAKTGNLLAGGSAPVPPASATAPKQSAPKRRMRAEDMFASDED